MASCQMRLLVCSDDDDMPSLQDVNKCAVRKATAHCGENISIPMYCDSINIEPVNRYRYRDALKSIRAANPYEII